MNKVVAFAGMILGGFGFMGSLEPFDIWGFWGSVFYMVLGVYLYLEIKTGEDYDKS